MIDLKQVEEIVRQEVTKRVLDELQSVNISSTLQATLLSILTDKTDVLVTNVLNRMITDNSLQSLVSTKLMAGLQSKLDAEITNRVVSTVSRTDIGQTISDKIAEFVDNKMKSGSLPDKFIPQKAVDLSNLTIRPEQVTNGKFEKFRSAGITDQATSTTLAISDGLLVVDGQTSTSNLTVHNSAKIGELEVTKQLKLSGDLLIANQSFIKDMGSLIEDKLTAERQNWKLDIGGDALYANNKPLLTADTLAPTVTTSNLRKVGNLVELSVSGTFNVGDGLTVQGNKVGINTSEPDGALHVWDQETEFTVRRQQSRTTYIGTSRDNELAIGVGGEVIMLMHKDGTVAIPKISLDGLKISISDTPPSREGVPGEIMIMRRAVGGQPWAYQCLEGQTWAAMTR